METKPLKKLQQWCVNNNIENIEEMLTAITTSNAIIKNPKVHGLLNSVLYPDRAHFENISIRDIDAILLLENMLNTFFSLLIGTMLRAEPNEIHKTIAEFLEGNHRTDIITTNYDGCLDNALDKLNVKYNYVLNASNSSESINLVKMHGSINWFYCNSCQHVLLPTIQQIHDAIEQSIPYSVLGMCPNCTALANQFIIPPISQKYLTHPPIVQVWEKGRKIFERVKVVVVVGYSFSDADDYIAKMIVKSIVQNPEKYIININNDGNSIEKCRSFIKSHAEEFNDREFFLPLIGDGVDYVPNILSILNELLQKEQMREKKEQKKTKKK